MNYYHYWWQLSSFYDSDSSRFSWLNESRKKFNNTLPYFNQKLLGWKQLNSTAIGLISIILALFALSFTAIFFKIGASEISTNAIIFNRLWIATLVLGLLQEINKLGQLKENSGKKDSLSNYTKQERWLIVLVAISSTASVIVWAWSLTQTSVANSTVLRNLTPLFTSLCGWLILKQKFDRQFCWGMVIAIVGAITIGWDDWQVSADHFLGDATALFSALLYAIYLLASEQLRVTRNTTNILFWRCTIGVLLVLPIALFTNESLFPTTWQGWVTVIALAVVCQVCGQSLLIYSLNQFSSSFVALFLLLTPINSAILAWLIFAESLTWLNAMAFVLVLSGIYLAQSSQSVQKS